MEYLQHFIGSIELECTQARDNACAWLGRCTVCVRAVVHRMLKYLLKVHISQGFTFGGLSSTMAGGTPVSTSIQLLD